MAQWFPSDASLQASFRAHISSLSSPTPLLGGLVMPRALVGDALTALRPTGLVAPSAPHVHRLAHLASEAAACLGGAEQDREDLPQWVHACVAVTGPPPPPLTTAPTPLASSSSSAAAETWLGELRFLELVPSLSPPPSSSSSGLSSSDLSLPPAVAAALPPAISARLRWAVLPVPTPGDKSATRPVDMTHWARLFPAPAQTHSEEEDDDEGENDQRGASLASVSPLTPENVAAAASVSFLPGHSFAGSGRFDSTSHASSTESDVVAAEGAAARAALFAIRTLSSSESSQSNAPYTPLPSRFTFIELFSGLGGFRTALAALGGVSVAACDIEPRAREAYVRAHAPGGGVEQVCARVARVCNEGCGGPIYSNAGVNVVDGSGMPLDQLKRAAVAAVDSHKTDDMWSPCPVPALLLPDVTSLPSSLIPPHTILTAGFPCQPFSRLGGQPGTADAVKGTLFQHVMRIAAECKPPVVMLENVPGLVTIDNSRTLLSVLSALTAAGYSGAYKVVDAGGLVPQTRRRIYIIGIRTSLLSYSRPFSFPLCPPPTHRTLAPSLVSLPSLLPAHVVSLVRYHRAVCAPGSPFVTTQRWKLACPQRRAGTLTTGYRRGIGYHSQFVPLSQDEVAQLSPEVAAVLNAPATEAVGDTHTFDDLSKAHALPTAVRWFTERECARLMGFPEAMSLVDLPAERVSALDCAAEETEHHGEAAKRARHAPVGDKDKASSSGTGGAYGLLGNAVCPPTIALLAGSALAYLHSLASPLPVSECPEASAVEASGGVGAAAAAALAFAAAAPGEREIMMQRLEAAAAAAASE